MRFLVVYMVCGVLNILLFYRVDAVHVYEASVSSDQHQSL